MKTRLASKILKKMIFIILVIIIQGIFLYAYYDNQDFISFFRISYLTDIYIPIYTQKTNEASKYLASVVQFNKNKGNSEPQNKRENATSIPVLLYHGVVDNSDDANILLKDFRNQMFALKKDGWQTISIDDFYKFMQGEKELPDKSFLLTFDDGRKDSYYPVDPILKALNYRATIFVITEHSFGEASPFYLSKKELIKMVKSGRWDIQAHTKIGHDFYDINAFGAQGHFYSNKLWLDNEKRLETEDEFRNRIHEDFEGAKQDLQNTLKINSIAFAFPFGDFGQRTINFLDVQKLEETVLRENESVYKLAFYQVTPGIHSIYNYPTETSYLIKRINIRPEWTPDNLLKILDADQIKKLPYYDSFIDYNGWIKDFGRRSFSNNSSMIINAHGLSKGSSVTLDGSYLWENYIFKAKINWIKGETVSLIARLKDNKNYVSCSFNDKKIKIEQYLNGKKRIMAEKEITFKIPKENLELGIAVDKDKINCLIDGKSAIYSYYLSSVLSNGGIGLKIWDKEVNNSKIFVKEVKVDEIKNGENLVFTAISEKYAKTEETAKKELNEKKEKEAAEIVVSKDNQKEKDSKKETVNIVLAPKIESEILKTEEIQEPAHASSPILLPYNVKNFDDNLSWKKLWGGFAIKDNLLHIVSTASTTSGFTIFEKSLDWENYIFKTKLDWLKGESFSLVARYKDAKNYVSCSFSNYGKSVNIYQVLNGETKTLGRTGVLPVPFFTPWLNLDFSVKVNGDNIECLINNEWVLRDEIKTMPKSGGIGFKIWGNKSYNNEVMIKEITVDNI